MVVINLKISEVILYDGFILILSFDIIKDTII
jgi:hypothetical protein